MSRLRSAFARGLARAAPWRFGLFGLLLACAAWAEVVERVDYPSAGGALPTSAPSAARDAWYPLLSEAGAFRIELPREPRAERGSRSTLAGEVHYESFTFEDAEQEVEAEIEFHLIPRPALWFVSDREVRRRSANTVIAARKAREIASRELRHGEHAVLAVEYEAPSERAGGPPLRGSLRILLIAPRVYILSFSGPEQAGREGAERRFFASFEPFAEER